MLLKIILKKNSVEIPIIQIFGYHSETTGSCDLVSGASRVREIRGQAFWSGLEVQSLPAVQRHDWGQAPSLGLSWFSQM